MCERVVGSHSAKDKHGNAQLSCYRLTLKAEPVLDTMAVI